MPGVSKCLTRAGRLLDLTEEKHSPLREHMEERLDVFEGDYSAGPNAFASIRSLRGLAPPLEERIHALNPNFNLVHV